MKEIKDKVNAACSKIWEFGYSQIVIDLVQDTIEPLLEEEVIRNQISAAVYDCGLLLDVFNPELTKDIALLTELQNALSEWEGQHEFVNKTLGLPPES